MSYVLSWAAIAAAWYSAFVVDKDSRFLLLHQETVPKPSLSMDCFQGYGESKEED